MITNIGKGGDGEEVVTINDTCTFCRLYITSSHSMFVLDYLPHAVRRVLDTTENRSSPIPWTGATAKIALIHAVEPIAEVLMVIKSKR